MSDSYGDDHFSDDHTDSDGEDQSPNNAPIMSIFASYYGIEDPAVIAESKVVKEGIDDVHFQAEKFVKDLLVNEPIESLVSKDAEMVHEIRTLDGEMQKLVYDNYNKFITATETIKEMKKDVFAMDHDMDSVKEKMTKIATDSKELDNILEDKRAQVDKLVRVKRLLTRLEFLSELPERLSQMIDQQLYKEAVQLYHKTISVLTRHSHVLSFKNIKERTELMMSDLTEKVINLLEDPSLEAVKLTQYVSVLRMMNAPSSKVLTKLLAAHQHRSLRLIAAFQNSLRKAPHSEGDKDNHNSSSSSLQESLQLLESLQDLSKARQFHQHLLVGLIEACKGVFELFDLAHNTGTLSASSTAAIQQAYDALRVMITTIMKEYSKTLSSAFQRFFARFQSYFQKEPIDFTNTLSESDAKLIHECHSLLYPHLAQHHNSTTAAVVSRRSSHSSVGASSDRHSDDDEEEEEEEEKQRETAKLPNSEFPHNDHTAVNRFELHEERNGWLLLARQSILDVMYLDSMLKDSAFRLLGISYKTQGNHPIAHSIKSPLKNSQNKTSNTANGTTTPSSGANSRISEEIPSHAVYFADMILAEIHCHNTAMRQVLVTAYVQHAVTYWLPKIRLLTPFPVAEDITTTTHEEVTKTAHDSSDGENPAQSPFSHQSLLTSRTQLASFSNVLRHIFEHIHRESMETFAECIRYYKPVLDIYEAVETERSLVTILTADLTSSYLGDMINAVVAACGLKLHHTTANTNTTNGDGAKKRGSAEEDDSGEEKNGLGTDDIYEAEPCELVDGQFKTFLPHQTTHSSVQQIEGLVVFIFVAILRLQHGDNDGLMLDQMDRELQEVGFPSLAMCGQRAGCHAALGSTIQVLTTVFLEANLTQFSQQFSELVLDVVVSEEHTDARAYQVTPSLMAYLTRLDVFAQLVYLLLNEALPNHALQNVSQPQRRASVNAAGARTLAGPSSLQFDIERLFSAKVQIVDDITATLGAADMVNMMIKTSLGQCHEHLRMCTITPKAYASLQTSLSMMKHSALCLMKDVAEVEFLINQVLHTAFSRYVDANDIANASDSSEMAAVSRGVQEGFGKLCVEDGAVLLALPKAR